MSGRIIFGFILFFFGLGLLLNTTQVIEFSNFVSNWWPVILIVLGLVNLLQENSSRSVGFFFIVLGGGLLLVSTGVLSNNFWSYFWPGVLIILGLWIMLPMSQNFFRTKKIKDSQVNINSFFSSHDYKVVSEEFYGGQINSFFGATDLDLTKSTLGGNDAIIEANAFFGGIDIRVPNDWKVVSRGLPLFGAWENRTLYESSLEKPRVLIVKGVAMFGGIEIKN